MFGFLLILLKLIVYSVAVVDNDIPPIPVIFEGGSLTSGNASFERTIDFSSYNVDAASPDLFKAVTFGIDLSQGNLCGSLVMNQQQHDQQSDVCSGDVSLVVSVVAGTPDERRPVSDQIRVLLPGDRVALQLAYADDGVPMFSSPQFGVLELAPFLLQPTVYQLTVAVPRATFVPTANLTVAATVALSAQVKLRVALERAQPLDSSGMWTRHPIDEQMPGLTDNDAYNFTRYFSYRTASAQPPDPAKDDATSLIADPDRFLRLLFEYQVAGHRPDSLAELRIANCSGLVRLERDRCLRPYFLALGQRYAGTDYAVCAMHQMFLSGGLDQCEPMALYVAQQTFDRYPNVAEALESCRLGFCGSGCEAGFISAFVADLLLDALKKTATAVGSSPLLGSAQFAVLSRSAVRLCDQGLLADRADRCWDHVGQGVALAIARTGDTSLQGWLEGCALLANATLDVWDDQPSAAAAAGYQGSLEQRRANLKADCENGVLEQYSMQFLTWSATAFQTVKEDICSADLADSSVFNQCWLKVGRLVAARQGFHPADSQAMCRALAYGLRSNSLSETLCINAVDAAIRDRAAQKLKKPCFLDDDQLSVEVWLVPTRNGQFTHAPHRVARRHYTFDQDSVQAVPFRDSINVTLTSEVRASLLNTRPDAFNWYVSVDPHGAHFTVDVSVADSSDYGPWTILDKPPSRGINGPTAAFAVGLLVCCCLAIATILYCRILRRRKSEALYA